MPIQVPDQGSIDLGRSRTQAVDTYVGAAKPDTSNLDDLARSLGNFAGVYQSAQDKQERQDLQRTEYYSSFARGIIKDVKEGGPIEAQLQNILPWQSQAVRSRVAENLGFDEGRKWIDAKYKELYSDPAALTNPEELARRTEAIRLEARERVKDQPDWGNGFLKSVEGALNQYGASKSAERIQLFTEEQAKGYARDVLTRSATAHAGAQVSYKTVDAQPDKYKVLPTLLPQGKSAEHIGKLSAPFADKLELALSEMPPELRKTMQVNSGYRGVDRQRELYEAEVARQKAKGLGEAEAARAARKNVAPPGSSNHNHGEAMDLAAEGRPAKEFANTAAGKWLHANAEKYGLYFPMGHEPWHIEQRGGRREVAAKGGSPNHRPNVHHDADGHDHDDKTPVDKVVAKIGGAESGNNPAAQNSVTSAGGKYQFVDKTWLAEAREVNPALKSKSDAEVLALKKDTSPEGVKFQTQVATNFTKKNADRVAATGAPVTEGNIYVMHFLGEGDGAKVLRARSGTRVEDIVTPQAIRDNPFLAGLTASEVRQWAAEKMGNATNGVSRARNAVREADREWGESSSLDNVYRRNVVSKALQKAAVESLDPSVLDRMPPELMTPEVRSEFLETRRKVLALHREQLNAQRQEKKQAEEDEYHAHQKSINEKLVKGEKLDLREYVNNPRAFDYARERQNLNLNLSEAESEKNSALFQNDLFAASLTGNYDALKNLPAIRTALDEGRTPNKADIVKAISEHPGMRSQEVVALLKQADSITKGANIVGSPEVRQRYENGIGMTNKAAMQTVMAKAQSITHVLGLETATRKMYEGEVQAGVLAYISKTGSPPPPHEMREIIDRAETKAMALQDRYMKIIEKGKPEEKEAIRAGGKGLPEEGTPIKPEELTPGLKAALGPGQSYVRMKDGTLARVGGEPEKPKDKPKPEPKAEPKAEPKSEPKPKEQAPVEPKKESKANPGTLGSTDARLMGNQVTVTVDPNTLNQIGKGVHNLLNKERN
jgi:hypothetical protein